MRINTKNWTFSAASHIGHYHITRQENCQDAFSLAKFKYVDKQWVIGVVCDGCGGSSIETENGTLAGKPEVAASLLSDLVIAEAQIYMRYDISFCLRQIFNEVVTYIQHATSSNPAIQTVQIQRFWLATILGFIIDDEYLTIFHAGDGEIGINDEIIDIDQNDEPNYIAYNSLLRPEECGVTTKLTSQFEYKTFPLSDISRFMIATDGFINHKPIVSDISLYGEHWGKKGKTGLKRWLNVKSQQGYFNDDVSLIVAESLQL